MGSQSSPIATKYVSPRAGMLASDTKANARHIGYTRMVVPFENTNYLHSGRGSNEGGHRDRHPDMSNLLEPVRMDFA